MTMIRPGLNCTKILIPTDILFELMVLFERDPTITKIRNAGSDHEGNTIIYLTYKYQE